MPVRAVRVIHAANLRLDASFAPPGPLPDDLRTLFDEAAPLALAQIIAAALEHDVDALVITGNTFDAAAGSLSAEVTLRRELGRLHEQGLPVFIAPGFLDPASAWHEIPPLPDNVTVFLKANEPGVELTERGRTLATILPVSARTAADAPELDRLRGTVPAPGVTIGLWIPEPADSQDAAVPGFSSLTYLAAGATPGTWRMPLTEGHVHAQPGPQGLNATETGPQGCQLVEIDQSGKIDSRLIPVAPVRWETCTVDGRGVLSADELCERMLARLEQLTGYPGEKCRIITWSLDQALLEAAEIHTERELETFRQTLVELTDQPKTGLRYHHCLEAVWDETRFPAAVDRELWQDYLAEMERWTPLEMDRLAKLWEQQTGSAAAPTGWQSERRWPPVVPERVRRRALQNGRRWFRPATGGASR